MSKKRILRDNVLIGLGLVLMIAALYMVFFICAYRKEHGHSATDILLPRTNSLGQSPCVFITFIFSIFYLWKREMKWDSFACASAEIGIIFTTLVLITGPIWAKPIWGIWWTWDARLSTSLVLWLIYVAYLLARNFANEPARGARFGAVIGIVGFIDVPLVFLAVKLWRTQHPTNIIFEGGLTAPMLLTLIVCIAAFTTLYILLLIQSANMKIMDAHVKNLKSMNQ